MVTEWVAGISIGFMRRLSFFSTNDKFGMSTVHIKCVLCFPPSASSETQVSPCLSEHVKVRLPDESILCKNSSRFTCNTEGISRERRDVLVAVPRISMLIYANRQKIYELLKGGKKPHCVPSMLSVWTGDGGKGGVTAATIVLWPRRRKHAGSGEMFLRALGAHVRLAVDGR